MSTTIIMTPSSRKQLCFSTKNQFQGFNTASNKSWLRTTYTKFVSFCMIPMVWANMRSVNIFQSKKILRFWLITRKLSSFKICRSIQPSGSTLINLDCQAKLKESTESWSRSRNSTLLKTLNFSKMTRKLMCSRSPWFYWIKQLTPPKSHKKCRKNNSSNNRPRWLPNTLMSLSNKFINEFRNNNSKQISRMSKKCSKGLGHSLSKTLINLYRNQAIRLSSTGGMANPTWGSFMYNQTS